MYDMTQDDQEKYSKLIESIGSRAIDSRTKSSFLDNNDGGLVNRLGEANSSYLNGRELKVQGSDQVKQAFDSYIDSLLKATLDPSKYEAMTEAQGSISESARRRDFLKRYAERELHLQRGTLDAKEKELGAHGRTEKIAYDLTQQLLDPNQGFISQDINEKLSDELKTTADAMKLLTYFNDEVLSRKGMQLPEDKILELSVDTNEALFFMRNMITEPVDLYDKYGVRPLG